MPVHAGIAQHKLRQSGVATALLLALGRFHVSWPWVGIIVLLLRLGRRQRLRFLRRHTCVMLRRQANVAAELDRLVEMTPSWVNYSEVEQVRWMNSVLKILWPSAKSATEEIVLDTLNPVLEMIKPSVLAELRMAKFDMGEKPLLITGVNCVRECTKAVVLDLSISLVAKTDVVIQAKSAGVSVSLRLANLSFIGKLRVELCLLHPRFPCFKAMTFSLTDKPVINFDIAAVGVPLMVIPGLHQHIRQICSSTLAESLVLPKKTIVPIEFVDAKERLRLSEVQATGVLRVKVLYVSGTGGGLDNVQELRERQLPFADLSLSNMRHQRTGVASQDTDRARWDQCFEWLVWDHANDALTISVMTQDVLGRTTLIGKVDVPIVLLTLNEVVRMDAPLEEGSAQGVVLFEVQYTELKLADAVTVPLGTYPASVEDKVNIERGSWDKQFGGDYISVTLLDFVYTGSTYCKVVARIMYDETEVGKTVAREVFEERDGDFVFCFEEAFAFEGKDITRLSLELVDFESDIVFGKVLFTHWHCTNEDSIQNTVKYTVANIEGCSIGQVVMRVKRLKPVGSTCVRESNKEAVTSAPLSSLMRYTSGSHQLLLSCECFCLYMLVWLLSEDGFVSPEATALWWCMFLLCICGVWHLCQCIYDANMATWTACNKTLKLRTTSRELASVGITVDLPQWFTFPDIEKAEWVNEALAILWPQTKQAIKSSLISAAKSLGFVEVEVAHFGDLPPSVTGIKAYDKSKLSRQVMIDVDMEFSNSIVVKIGIRLGPLHLSIWVTSLSFTACARLTLEGFIPTFPCFSLVGISFIAPPKIELDVDLGLISINSIPGGHWCIQTVVNYLAAQILWPSKLDLSIWEPLSSRDKVDRHLRAKGVLRVHMLSATGLQNVDWFTLSDPYCNILVHDEGYLPKKHSTKVVDNSLSPVWDERKEFVVENPSSLVTFVVKDDDTIGKNKVLGEARLRISDLGADILADLNLPLLHFLTPQGSVNARLEWKPLSNEVVHCHSAEGWSVAVVSLYIDSVYNLFGGESAYDAAECYIKVRCGSEEKRTSTIHSSNPAFREHFSLLVHDLKLQKVKISVHSDTFFSNHTLGTLVYDLRDVISSRGLSGSFALANNPFHATIDLDINLRTIESDTHNVAVEGLEELRNHRLQVEGSEQAPPATRTLKHNESVKSIYNGIDVPHGILKIKCKRGDALLRADSHGLSDAYLKIIFRDQVVRTKTVARSLSPAFDEVVQVNIHAGDSGEVQIQCKHNYYSYIWTNQLLGETRVPIERIVAKGTLDDAFTIHLHSDNGPIDTGTLYLAMTFTPM